MQTLEPMEPESTESKDEYRMGAESQMEIYEEFEAPQTLKNARSTEVIPMDLEMMNDNAPSSIAIHDNIKLSTDAVSILSFD